MQAVTRVRSLVLLLFRCYFEFVETQRPIYSPYLLVLQHYSNVGSQDFASDEFSRPVASLSVRSLLYTGGYMLRVARAERRGRGVNVRLQTSLLLSYSLQKNEVGFSS